MKPAIIVVDMLEDNLKESSRNPYSKEGGPFFPISRDFWRRVGKGLSYHLCLRQFLKEDFIFKGKMKVHSLRGTKGAEVAEDLNPSRQISFYARGASALSSKPTWIKPFELLVWTRSS